MHTHELIIFAPVEAQRRQIRSFIAAWGKPGDWWGETVEAFRPPKILLDDHETRSPGWLRAQLDFIIPKLADYDILRFQRCRNQVHLTEGDSCLVSYELRQCENWLLVEQGLAHSYSEEKSEGEMSLDALT